MLGWRKDKREAEEGGAFAPSPSSSVPPAPAQPAPERRRLGEMLLDEGIITQDQLDAALKAKEEKGGFIGQALVELGHIDQRTLISFLVKQCKIPYISLLDYEISRDLLALIPRETCLNYRLLPIDKMGRILTVAMVDPLDANALDSVREACPELRLKPILCDWNHFDTVASRLFAQSDGGEPQEMTAQSLGLSTREPAPRTSAAPSKDEASAGNEDGEEEALNKAVADLLNQAESESEETRKPKQDPGASLTAMVEEQERKKAQADTVPAPLPDEEELESGGASAQAGLPAARYAAGPSRAEITEAIREGVRGAMSESLKALGAEIRESLAAQAAPVETGGGASVAGPTPEELAAVFGDGVQKAMDKSLKALGAEIRESLAAQAVPAKGGEKAAAWNAEALAAGLKEPLAKAMDGAVSKSMEQVGVVIAREMKAAAPKQASAPAPPTPEAMAGAVREAVSEGLSVPLQKSMDALGKEFKQALAHQKTPQAVSAEDIAGAIRDSVGEALASTAKSITKEIQGLQAAQGSAPDPSVYVEAMQTALRSAVKEALAPFGNSVEAQRAQEDERLRVLQEAFEAQTKEASQTGKAVQAAMKELRGALAAQQKETGSGAADGQLQEAVSAAREAAEAAKQAVEAMQTQTVQTPPRHPFAPAGGSGASPSVKGAPGATNASAPADEAAVTPFPGQHKGAGETARGEREVLEAIEGPGAKTRSDARVREALDSEHPQTTHTFDRFFVSKANQFAFAMAQAVAQEPGGEYSPFYIHGDVGVGKTHLINAIANGVRAMDPDRRVGYVTASRFAERLEEALHRHEAAKVRHAYAQWDVLVVDDVQFLAGRAAAQEELFHILNALGREDRQIILAGAAAPAHLTGVDKGLISRFNGGIVSALEAPDHATRTAILEHQAAAAGVRIPHEILEVIASRVPHDMRKMTGALRKVIAFAGLVGQELDSAQGWEILDQLGITEAA